MNVLHDMIDFLNNVFVDCKKSSHLILKQTYKFNILFVFAIVQISENKK